ncbi:hypothetical protein NORO109296_26405 [Nocardiopsis rhodophaea]
MVGEVGRAERPLGPVPAHRHPDGVADHPVGELGIDIGPEDTLGLAVPDHVDPDVLDLLLAGGEVAEAGELPQIVPVVLHHGDGRAVRLERPVGGVDQLGQQLARITALSDRAAVVAEEVVEEGREDLVDDRLLGVEVVVQAAGEDARLVGDLADRGGLEALLGEEIGREAHEVAPPFRGEGGRALPAPAAPARGAPGGVVAGVVPRAHRGVVVWGVHVPHYAAVVQPLGQDRRGRWRRGGSGRATPRPLVRASRAGGPCRAGSGRASAACSSCSAAWEGRPRWTGRRRPAGGGAGAGSGTARRTG